MSGQETVPRRRMAERRAFGGGGLPPEGNDELGGEETGFEFLRREVGEVHAAGEFCSGHFQGLSSFVDHNTVCIIVYLAGKFKFFLLLSFFCCVFVVYCGE